MKLRSLVGYIAAAAGVWGLAVAAADQDEDYLTADLRERVEALKTEASSPSSDIATLSARLSTLWEWANAYSLTGGPVPGGFPQLTANANRTLRGLPDGGAQIPLRRIHGFIAQYVREFQIKDENPSAVGTLKLSSQGPFRARESVSLSQTYTVGEMPMAPGGGIVIGQGPVSHSADRRSARQRLRIGDQFEPKRPIHRLGTVGRLDVFRDPQVGGLPPRWRETGQGRHRNSNPR